MYFNNLATLLSIIGYSIDIVAAISVLVVLLIKKELDKKRVAFTAICSLLVALVILVAANFLPDNGNQTVVPSVTATETQILATSVTTTATPARTFRPTATAALTPTSTIASIPELSGKTLFTFIGNKSEVTTIAWSPNGQFIASGGYDNTVQIRQATTGHLVRTYGGAYYSISFIAWSPDSKYIAAATDNPNATDNTIQIFDVATGTTKVSYKGHPEGVSSISWSPNGNDIASTGSSGELHVWDVGTGNDYITNNGSFYRVAWSPDGKYIAAETGVINGSVWVYSSSTGQLVWDYWIATDGIGVGVSGIAGEGLTLAWSSNSQQIAILIGSEICDTQSCDNTTLKIEIDVVDSASGHLIFSCQNSANATEVSWSPDGKYIGAASGNTVQIFDATTGNLVLTYRGHKGDVNVMALTWAPDSSRIASADTSGNVNVWQV